MEKLRISVPKIHCRRTTREIGKDDIYGLIIVTPFIANEPQKPFLYPIPLEQGVSRKSAPWVGIPSPIEVDIPESIEKLAIVAALYEKDNGEIYDAIMSGATGEITPERFPWDDILAEITIEDIVNPAKIPGIAIKVGKLVMAHFRQDDLLGSHTVMIKNPDDRWDGFTRELVYRNHFG